MVNDIRSGNVILDIDLCIKIFKEDVNHYDFNNQRINQRYFHSIRVMDNCESLAIDLGLDDEKISIARLVGLLHDYGRFYQLSKLGTLSDKKMDHALIGAKLLFEDGLINKYTTDKRVQNIILKAILNHNTLLIDENSCNEEELLFCKLLRDCDKLDILYLIGNDESELNFPMEKASEKVLNDCKNQQMIKYEDIKTNGDKLLVQLCRIYDLNFDYSFKKIKKDKLIDTIYNKLDNKDIVKEYFDIINRYIDEKQN